MQQFPHVTVATVVERDRRFLMVKEKSEGMIVYNQPAGHLEIGETLAAAAVRETLEETSWQVKISQFLGVYHYTSPLNGICYIRHCFIAEPVRQVAGAELDNDILETLWLSLQEVEALSTAMRSPMVLNVIRDYLRGIRYPLSLISDY
ncbi:MAG: NUDIX hydrolase [Proteobacteria bacterium]|nr:NUDIX hydrolase [Pseudomonadota bacterium]